VKGDLFRKEVVEKIQSPEDLNSYVKVFNPRVWIILAGIAAAMVGLTVFAASTGYPVWKLLFGATA
jgi:phosphoribosylcarboxyaminoimidazole (NCAIR) mutase